MAAATFMQQLVALWKRNLILKRRTWKQTIQEFLMPIYFALLLIMIKAFVKPEQRPQIESFPQYSMNMSTFKMAATKTLLVTPDSNHLVPLMDEVVRKLGIRAQPPYLLFKNPTLAEEYYRINSSSISAGIDFGNSSQNLISYTIRMDNFMMANPSMLYTDNGKCRKKDGLSDDIGDCPANTYIHTGFAALQTAIDSAVIKLRSNYTGYTGADFSVEMFPKLSFLVNNIVIQAIASMYYIMAYAPFVSFLVSNLVAEKERKIKDGMKMMGLRDAAFWISWGSLYAVMIFAVTLVVVFLAFISKVLSQSSPVLFFLLLILYGFSIITMSCAMTPFFKKAQTAGNLAGFFTMIFALLYLAVSLTRTVGTAGPASKIPVAGQWALALLSPVALALGVDQAIYLDIAEGGMRFNNMDRGEFPIYAAITMLSVDTLLYGLLAVYFDNVMPGEYGQRRPLLYFLQPSYWCKRKPKPTASSAVNAAFDNSYSTDDVIPIADLEPVSSDLRGKDVIRIYEIKKTFSTGKTKVEAVSGVSMSMYEGQITALLGHNGAGKTTLINMLTGVLGATEGTATIYGKDVSDLNDLDEIRTMTGVCPQHDILFPNLSCEEHLDLYANIKGVPKDKQGAEIDQALKDVDLEDSRSKWSKELSGGQKRKLSVAIALIGDPKVIFLDEPTAGMDPSSRRHLWSLLKQRRPGRVILLTTHFMDEADILADRKAFINKGKLQCCGSSLFLKNRFGVGYHLGMVLKDPLCDKEQITRLVTSQVPEAALGREHGQELTYTLPLTSLPNFAALFAALEASDDTQTEAERLSIASYGVSMTSLEEVFLKLGDSVDDVIEEQPGEYVPPPTIQNYTTEATPGGQSQNGTTVSIDPSPLDLSSTSAKLIKGKELTKQQFWSLARLRLVGYTREKATLFFMFIFPIILVLVGAILIKTAPTGFTIGDPQTLIFSPVYYGGFKLPVLIQPSPQDTDASSAFVLGIAAQVGLVDHFNSSTRLLDRAPHFFGIRIHDIDQTQQDLSGNLTAVYNDTAVHSLPVSLNMINNALYKMATGDPNSAILTASKPWPALKTEWKISGAAISSGVLIGMALAMLPLATAYLAVQDREIQARCMLRVSGITMNVYWGVLLLTSSIHFLFVALISFVILVAFQMDALKYAGATVSMLLIFIMYVPVNILMAACFSFGFEKADSVGSVLSNLLIWMCWLPYLLVSIVDSTTGSSAATIMHYVFSCIDPPYLLTGGLYYVDRVYRTQSTVQQTSTPNISFWEYFKWDNHVLITILMPIVHSVWMYFLLRFLEVRSTGGDTRDVCHRGSDDRPMKDFLVPKQNDDIIEDEDEDVALERQRVEDFQINPPEKKPVVMLQSIRKEFRKRNASRKKKKVSQKDENILAAVRNLSIAVETKEVFGLLGPNGAGKTTALNMVIAEVGPTKGGVQVAGVEITSSLSPAYQALGYCPQHNPIWPAITLREHIEVYAAIKGMPKTDIPVVADYLIDNLKLGEHADKNAAKLSGGTKRKLSYCISMLGGPQVVLLDEPSTGMDPVSKRFLWDTISSNFHSDERGAILTTHYMEEADALCSRVGIMINGELRCLGSTQHLKYKFGSGYILEVKLGIGDPGEQESRMSALQDLILDLFPGAELNESFEERAMYKIPQGNVTSLSQVFAALEEGKRSHGIEEYSFSQSTLEQVFLEFAKQQMEEGGTAHAETKRIPNNVEHSSHL